MARLRWEVWCKYCDSNSLENSSCNPPSRSESALIVVVISERFRLEIHSRLHCQLAQVGHVALSQLLGDPKHSCRYIIPRSSNTVPCRFNIVPRRFNIVSRSSNNQHWWSTLLQFCEHQQRNYDLTLLSAQWVISSSLGFTSVPVHISCKLTPEVKTHFHTKKHVHQCKHSCRVKPRKETSSQTL